MQKSFTVHGLDKNRSLARFGPEVLFANPELAEQKSTIFKGR